MSPPILTLLTDFGTRDEYVAVVKGVLLSRCPDATLVDVTHEIEPGDVAGAAFRFEAVFPFFPPGTVHLLVVDPGVGGERDAVAVSFGKQFAVAPDNGLLTPLLESRRATAAIRVADIDRFGPRTSETFHGRDVFAPVAAELAAGRPLESLGTPVDPAALIRLDRSAPAAETGAIRGRVAGVDRFGNLITDIRRSHLRTAFGRADAPATRVGGRWIAGLRRCFSDVPPNHPVVYIGSRGTLEIAVNGGSAAQRFGVETGAEIGVFSPPDFETRAVGEIRTVASPSRKTRNPSAVPRRFRDGRTRRESGTGRMFRPRRTRKEDTV